MGWLMGGVGCGSEERVGNGMGIGPVHGTFIRGPAESARGSMTANLDASQMSVVSTSDNSFSPSQEIHTHQACITNHASLKRWRSRNPMKEPSQSPRALPLIRLALAALDLSALVEEGEVREGAQQSRAAQLAGRAPRL